MSEFVEIKVGELSGAALDWAVAKSEGLDLGELFPASAGEILRCWFYPSIDWSQCGPLIEKYRPALEPSDKEYGAGLRAGADYVYSTGSTPLIAACRAIVASVLGETVNVPKELV